MVVLHEAICDAKLGEFVLMVSFREEAPLVAKHFRPQLENAGREVSIRCMRVLIPVHRDPDHD